MPETDGPVDPEPLMRLSEMNAILVALDALGDRLRSKQLAFLSDPEADEPNEVLLGLASTAPSAVTRAWRIRGSIGFACCVCAFVGLRRFFFAIASEHMSRLSRFHEARLRFLRDALRFLRPGAQESRARNPAMAWRAA
jgi:hypothetical protein